MSENSIAILRLRNVLIVSIPAEPVDAVITSLQDRILHTLQQTNAHAVILDLSTVDIMDSFFARTVIDTAQMINLMGAKTAIAGMLPSVAITATQLGLTFDTVLTCLDVDEAFSQMETREQ